MTVGKRGRQSAAALALVQETPLREGKRPAAPGNLTVEQAAEWDAIVASLPASWFRRENYPLLEQYCVHAVSARFLSAQRDTMERAAEPNWAAYEWVSKLLGRETALLTSLATKMRLSQHASYDKKKSKGPSLPKPWEG